MKKTFTVIRRVISILALIFALIIFCFQKGLIPDFILGRNVGSQLKQVEKGEKEVYKDKWGYNYYKNLDNIIEEYDRTLFYQRIYDACANFQSTITLLDLKVSEEDAWRIYCSMRLDNPELIQTEPGYTMKYNPDTGYVLEFTASIKERDSYDFDKLREDYEKAVEEVAAIIKAKHGSNASKVKIVKEIHDYIVFKNEYADSDFDQSMAGVFSTEYTPVCASYSLAFKYLCNQFGIQCEVVTGEVVTYGVTGAHMWNLINYGDNVDYSNPGAYYHPETWYEMDVTWDDPRGMGVDTIQYDYYNVTSSEMKKDHTRNNLYYVSYPIEECYGITYSYANCIMKGYFRTLKKDKE